MVNTNQRKQARILAILVVVLLIIAFNPIIRLGIGALFPRDPIRLGPAEISIPQDWTVSRASTRVEAWKPCNTILCGSLPRASFYIEPSKMPPGSDGIWLDAATKIISKNYSAEANSKIVDSTRGPLKCVELDGLTQRGETVVACLNPDLRLTSLFVGEPTLKPVFYSVLTSARKIPG
jgi:hypothetical protein